MNDLIEAFENVWFFISGVWNVVISNWILSVPIAVMVMWVAFDIFKSLIKVIKKGG